MHLDTLNGIYLITTRITQLKVSQIYKYFYYSIQIVGYGCMTCISNSGSLAEPIVETIEKVSINWDVPC